METIASIDFTWQRPVLVTHGPEGICHVPEICELCAAFDEAYG